MRDEVGMNCEMCTDRALVVVLRARMGWSARGWDKNYPRSEEGEKAG